MIVSEFKRAALRLVLAGVVVVSLVGCHALYPLEIRVHAISTDSSAAVLRGVPDAIVVVRNPDTPLGEDLWERLIGEGDSGRPNEATLEPSDARRGAGCILSTDEQGRSRYAELLSWPMWSTKRVIEVRKAGYKPEVRVVTMGDGSEVIDVELSRAQERR